MPSTSSQKPPKIRRTMNPFVSLEAAEGKEESDEEDGLTDTDKDFFQYEPVVGDRESSHAHLHLEYERIEEREEGGWESFLERAQRRAKAELPIADKSASEIPGAALADQQAANYMPEPVKPTIVDTFYKVPVKPGWETTYTFRVMERIFSSGASSAPTIRSVLGRASYPGAIFIEATDVEAVYEACRCFTHASLHDIHKISHEQAILCLKERTTYTPHSPGWVRLTKGCYTGDTAYVCNVTDSLQTQLLIIPRIFGDGPKRRYRGRPPQALFDANYLCSSFKVEKRNQMYLYRGDRYFDGFLQTKMEDFDHNDTLPSREELQLFKKCPQIPPEFIQAAYDAIDASALRPGHRVLAICGPFQGQSGVVVTALSDTAQVQFPGLELVMDIKCGELRRDIQVGDEVKVVAGLNAGFTGWVVSVDVTENLVIFNHILEREVKEVIQDVEFWSSDVVVGKPNNVQAADWVRVVSGAHAGFVGQVVLISKEGEAKIAAPGDTYGTIKEPIENLTTDLSTDILPIAKHEDPNRRFIGRQVIVVGKRQDKQYRGFIRDTHNDGFASVELEAKLRRVRVKLEELAVLADGKLIRLNGLGERYLPPPEAAAFRELAPSTPLPSPFAQAMSPAWDPSARTPIPPSANPLTPATPLPPSWSQPVVSAPNQNPYLAPWFARPGLPLTRLKVLISGSGPVLHDPGWKQGRHENRYGTLTGIDGNGANVLLSLSETLHVPSKYIAPVRPDTVGEIVVAISGPNMGKEFTVSKVETMGCKLKPRGAKGRRIELVDLQTNSLCVVKP